MFKYRLFGMLAFAGLCEAPILWRMHSDDQGSRQQDGKGWILWEHAPLQIAINVSGAVLASLLLVALNPGHRTQVEGIERRQVQSNIPSLWTSLLLPLVIVPTWFLTSMATPTSPDPGQGSAIALFFLAPQFFIINWVTIGFVWPITNAIFGRRPDSVRS